MGFAERGNRLLAAWETEGEVRMGELGAVGVSRVVTPAGGPAGRKYPVVALDEAGERLLVWAEGAGFRRGGALAYQLFSAGGAPRGQVIRLDQGVPSNSLPAVAPAAGGGFLIMH